MEIGIRFSPNISTNRSSNNYNICNGINREDKRMRNREYDYKNELNGNYVDGRIEKGTTVLFEKEQDAIDFSKEKHTYYYPVLFKGEKSLFGVPR